MYIIGADEAGRGPVIGPMVVCAVAMHKDMVDGLTSMGIRDSKKLTPKVRKDLAKRIRNMYIHSLNIIQAEEIDLMRSEMSMNEIEVLAFSRVILDVVSKVMSMDPTANGFTIYIDSADVNEDRFGDAIKSSITSIMDNIEIDVISKHRADSTYAIVGAASILAKVKRDDIVEKIAKELERAIPGVPLGSGYPSDPRTVAFIREYIRKYHILPPHTRNSWKTVKRLAKEFGIECCWHKSGLQKTLLDF